MKRLFFLFCACTMLSSCADAQFLKKMLKKADEINLLTIEQEMDLGKKVKSEIESDVKNYPILPEKGNEAIYTYIRGITTKILNSGKVANREAFAWEVKIIRDDKTLNAFCTPGGYIYVYTGLIKFLDSEDQLAGVMGHEIAHAAQRHTGRSITKAYGLEILLALLTGNSTKQTVQLTRQLTSSIVGLKFSRDHETEADEQSVNYLCQSSYNAAGAAGFFKKMQGKGGAPPEFLSTHPDPKNRVKEIETRAKAMGCSGTATHTDEYTLIKKLLK